MTATTIDAVPTAYASRRPADSGRSGGVAALVQAATFVFGFVIYGTIIAGGSYADPAVDASSHIAFLADNQLVLHLWYAAIYLVFGAALVVLACSLHDRIKSHAPTLARTATVFSLIWATLMFAVGMTAIVGGDLVLSVNDTDPTQAAALWHTVNLLIEGMGGGIEVVGGLWMALVSIAGLRAETLPVWLNRIGVVGGVAGIATTAMIATDAVTSVFGLASIVWFTWLGVHLTRHTSSVAVAAR